MRGLGEGPEGPGVCETFRPDRSLREECCPARQRHSATDYMTCSDRSYTLDLSCEHRSHFIEMREERSVIVCEGCGVQLAGWRIEVTLPFFLLEQADDAHVMYHLSQERREGEGERGSAA